jgi:DNA polymerase-3 subunit gamma/tau
MDCSCPACVHHQILSHPDLLILGSRAFSGEISAAAAAFLREPETLSARVLFIRSVRKLLARFSPVLWEDEPKFSKLSDSVFTLEEALDELWASGTGTEVQALKKRCDSILKTALKLESDGISDLIPIGHIRRAAAWSHLAPLGKGKLLLIENADRMQDGARNSLLKMLEEPPVLLTVLLTTSREKALLPTILSRVRPYRFVQRSPEVEAEVIRQVFRDEQYAAMQESQSGSGISAYLDSFLPVPGETLRPLAAFFTAFVATGAVLALKKRGIAPLPEELIALGKYTTAIAEAADLGKPGKDTQPVITKVLAEAEKFEVRGLFPQFINFLLLLVSESGDSLRQNRIQTNRVNGYYDIWRKYTGEAVTAVGIYNQSPTLALERLSTELRRAITEQFS